MGSTGRRLWCRTLKRRPGFLGEFVYLEPPILPDALFALEIREGARGIQFPPLVHRWWPSHVGMEGHAEGLHLVERKWIAEDDRAVDLVYLENRSSRSRDLLLRIRTDLPVGADLSGTFRGVPFALAAEGFRASSEDRTVHAAFNPDRTSDVQPRASFTWNSDSMWAPIDGEADGERRWTCWSSGNESDWYEIEFRTPREIRNVVLHFVDDQAGVVPPQEYRVLYEKDRILADVSGLTRLPESPARGRNEVGFAPVQTKRIRVVFTHRPGKYSGLREVEVYPGHLRKIPLLERRVSLPAGGAVDFPVEAAFGGKPRGGKPREIFEGHVERFNRWFAERIPDFDCDDPWFVKLWYHRWYVVRRALVEPASRWIRRPGFFASKQTDRGSRVSPRSHPFQVAELRWLRDPNLARDHCRLLFENQFRGREGFFDGEFPLLSPTRRDSRYEINWAARSPWSAYQVHPDLAFLEASLPGMRRYVRGILERFDSDRDFLPAVLPHHAAAADAHLHSGLPYQPSFFWFSDSKAEVANGRSIERVDFACALYTVVRALEEAGVNMADLSRKIRDAVCRKMWDEERRFFYSIEPASDRKARVEEIAGFFPHAFRLVPKGDRRYDAVFARLTDPGQFWAPVPVLTASSRAKMFSLEEPGERHANGPTWLLTNIVVLEALANAVKYYKIPSVPREIFFDLLRRTVLAQFEAGGFGRPRVGEIYHSQTGRRKTSSLDGFETSYADTLIRHVGGLTPRADETLEFHPIVDAFTRFRFQNIRYHGKRIDIVWDKPDGKDAYGDGEEGFTVKRDGKKLFTLPALRHVLWTERGGVRVLPD